MTTTPQAPNVRLTPERLERIRQFLSTDWLMRDGESALDYARALFTELSAVTRERDEAVRTREAGSTRVCDKPGCTACVIRRDDGSRVCAAGHASRFVERSDFDALRAHFAAHQHVVCVRGNSLVGDSGGVWCSCHESCPLVTP